MEIRIICRRRTRGSRVMRRPGPRRSKKFHEPRLPAQQAEQTRLDVSNSIVRSGEHLFWKVSFVSEVEALCKLSPVRRVSVNKKPDKSPPLTSVSLNTGSHQFGSEYKQFQVAASLIARRNSLCMVTEVLSVRQPAESMDVQATTPKCLRAM